MSVMPRDRVGQIQFCISHLPDWEENALAIGSDPATIADVAAKTAAAREAFNAQQAAIQTARSATYAFHLASDALATAAQGVITQAKAKAMTSGNFDVYTMALIPSPVKPSPINTLDTPNQFTVALDALGAVTIKWRCTHPRGATGVVYEIRRCIGRTDEFVPLAVVGKKRFTDNNIPLGTSRITYEVRAVRSTATGPWATFNVNLGGDNRAMNNAFTPRNAENRAA